MLACPRGEYATDRYGCQPLIYPHEQVGGGVIISPGADQVNAAAASSTVPRTATHDVGGVRIFSEGGFIGGFDWLFYNNVHFNESLDYAPTIPGVTFATYQMMFAVITPLLITGAFAERVKWNAFVVFIVAWSIFIYYPLAHWVW